MSGLVLITGAVSPQPAPRREIVELFSSSKPEDKAQVDLFLQALTNLQKRDPNDPTSYFQVAGVHGRPYTPYNPQPGDNTVKEQSSRWGGYCVHGDTLFPPWHRPYLAALEQFIQAEAVKIAATYKDQRELYQQAALNLRLPFWDWATNSTATSGFPSFLSQDNWTINLAPGGGSAQIRNPLVSYEFQTIPADFTGNFQNLKTTVRRPDVDAQLKSRVYTLQLGVRNIFDVQEWLDFSNHRTSSGSTNNGISSHVSLENLHDSVHGIIGGSEGHMGNPDYAAFDPVFFLHHCNVDRLFAIWQAAFPSVYVVPHAEDEGTFTIKDGEVETETTSLTPWRKSATAYWTSTDCRDIKSLNYTYPELEWKLDPAQLRAQMISVYGGKKLIRNFVNTVVAPQQQPSGVAQASVSSSASSGAPPKPGYTQTPDTKTHGTTTPGTTYGTTTPTGPYGTTETKPVYGEPKQDTYGKDTYGKDTHHKDYQPDTKPGYPPHYQPPAGYANYTRVENYHLDQFREWFALIDVRKNVHGGPFTIHVFIGDVPENHDVWTSSPNHCGSVTIFARYADTECSNCKKEPNVVVGGTVDLTCVMMRKGYKLGVEGGATAARLKKELKIRVFKHDSKQVIDGATIESLTLRIQTAAVELKQVADDKIKDSGNGRIAHRVPERRNWSHIEELDLN